MGALLGGVGAAIASGLVLLAAGVISLPGGDDATEPTTTTSSTVPESPFGLSPVLDSNRIGDYKVREDGSSQGAVKVFGEPNDQVRDEIEDSCTMTWGGTYRMEIVFYNLGGADPCRKGRFCRARLTGEHWRTTKRLQIGEAVRRLQRLYPDAQEFPSGDTTFWGLEPTEFACGRDARQGGLNAVVRDGVVIAFTVSFLGGGD